MSKVDSLSFESAVAFERPQKITLRIPNLKDAVPMSASEHS
jgi:hypothetical protein